MPRTIRNSHRNRGWPTTSNAVGYDESLDRLREVSDWMTVVEAAERAGVTTMSIYNWVKDRRLSINRHVSPFLVRYVVEEL